jgi:hypothetical protein
MRLLVLIRFFYILYVTFITFSLWVAVNNLFRWSWGMGKIYLSYAEAMAITQVTQDVLHKLVLSGIIKTVNTSTETLLNKADVLATLPITMRPEYTEFSHLSGLGISISEASRRYGVIHQNISRWVKSGLVERLGVLGRQTLIDEAQIATAAKIYNSLGGTQGKWVFRAGLLYQKKEKGGC